MNFWFRTSSAKRPSKKMTLKQQPNARWQFCTASNARVLCRESRRKRRPCQVHGIEQELRFKRLAKMCGLTKSVLLVLEYKETGRDVSALKRGVHALGLIDRHDRIVLTVKKYHSGGEPVGEIDRRTVVVKCAVGHKWLNEPVGVV